jgi:hypothetical protein
MLKKSARLWALLALTYVVGRLMAQAIFYGRWMVDAEFLALALVIPLVQWAALLGVGRLFRKDTWREDIH